MKIDILKSVNGGRDVIANQKNVITYMTLSHIVIMNKTTHKLTLVA